MSSLKMNTGEFKEMVLAVTKGAGNNDNVYMTELMSIELKDNVLTLTTTDGTNYLYAIKEKVSGDDFYAVVSVDKFSKLIAKQTCDTVELATSTSNNGELDKLIVKGNGKYVLELPYDVDGELVEFPDPITEVIDGDMQGYTKTKIKLSTVQLILTTARASLLNSSDLSIPYTGYYLADKIVTTDSYKICGIEIPVFDEPKLVSADTMALLDVMTSEDIDVMYNEDTIIFSTPTIAVYGKLMDSIDEFQIEPVSSLIDEPFKSSCRIDKSKFLQLLDRLSLFVNVDDKNGVYLTFTKDGLSVNNKHDNGEELIPYIESKEFADYTCCVDIGMLTSQVKANKAAAIDILYGKENTIKLVDGNVKQVIALSDDDRFSE